jgi:hypothetical protein
VSPADTNREHTLSTLRYASRALAIKNALHRSVMGPAQELAYLRELVAQLQEENAALKQVVVGGGLQLPLLGAAPTAVPRGGQQKLPGAADSICELYVRAC